MSTPEDFTAHKQHRDSKSGRKADKKKEKKKKPLEGDPKKRNPKAFTFNSAVKAERRFRRKQDVDTKKQHIPLIDRTPLEPPPVLVAVVGPPKVGKSLLIECLVKNFTKQPLSNITGPVTVVAGKRRRITFLECNNDINSMIDIAKVADLVLLLVDGYNKFEMETFEFLNICQVHGMPRIMGVLNHLDLYKNARQMRKTKKELKRRFWTEVYQGAKLFYLSGLLHDEYMRQEIKNLARFISVMKFRPITWRSTHPYLLVDRVEDLTDPELMRQNSKVDRNISLYGYVRGVPFHNQSSIHIPGCGDLKIKDISFLPDPCPLPEHLKKRALVERERLIYAPFSGVGGIVYDKDAVYIELGGSHHHNKDDDTGLVSQLLQTQETLDHKLEKSELQLFTGSVPIKSQDVKQIFMEEGDYNEKKLGKQGDVNGFLNDNDDDGDDSDEQSEDGMDVDNDDESDTEQEKSCESEDEDEDKDDEEDPNDADTSSNKRKAAQKLSGKKKMKLEISAPKEDEESTKVYRKLHINQDEHVKNKISEVLDLVDSIDSKKSKFSKRPKEDSDNESFDELSEDEEVDFESKLEKDEVGEDNEGDEEEEENQGEDEENDDDSEEEDDSPDNLKWKRNIAERAREAFLQRQQKNVNLQRLVYGVFDESKLEKKEQKEERDANDDENELGGIFRVVQEKQKRMIEERELKNQEECVFYSKEPPRDWLEESNKDLLINRFVTGKWKESEDAETLLKLDALDDGEVFDDFEDLETGKKFTAEEQTKKEDGESEETKEDDAEHKKLLEKKKKLKVQFDMEYDTTDKTYYDDLKEECQRQANLNKSEFEGLDDSIRVTLEGYRPGMYVRLEIDNVPCELIVNLDPSYPMVVGGLLPGEENIGYVQTRFKKHRWYPKILKSKDPIIMSVGWRRFQTIAIYSQLEHNMRNRMLKYTPEHVSCMAHFWGPITPQGTGVLAVQDVSRVDRNFRIIATGSIVEVAKSSKVMKKLKLKGVPYKLFKKTAFIRNMFTSRLEVAKFEGAKIKTVSGIRGMIKKPVWDDKLDGAFRATFEDKIQLSDIVFCRTWYPVEIPRFYNPVTSLLLPLNQKNSWTGMKTSGQLKHELNIHVEPNPDSFYTPIEREPKFFKPLFVPRSLQKELPYQDKPKVAAKFCKRKQFDKQRVAVVRDHKEANVARLMKMIRTNYAHKELKNKEATHKRMEALKKRYEEEEAKKLKRQRVMKKQIFSDLARMDKKNKNKAK
ncbi:ribosome biogenesis protein BMS1 homolog [Copidosoma floridanum]|uniref:ribosome biogenesis protein BMS1 homolog n=1 Tax=Copidosoma floridanum TaxID=29053 RepID=UPI0006C94235|nr:ribosome biogenesis protein BMS1 homolog [Copidosoma floridanum]